MLTFISITTGVVIIVISRKMIVYVASIPANGERKVLATLDAKLKLHKKHFKCISEKHNSN